MDNASFEPAAITDDVARQLLRSMFDAAVAAAQPALCLPPHLPERPAGRTVVIGAGKASAAMASVVEQHWEGALEGLVVTRYGYAVPCERIEVVEAAHPVPDEAGHQAARRIMQLVQGLTADDLVLCLISGVGSTLLSLPAPGISIEEKQAVNRALLASGATISEMNCVRRHLSAIKGGRLAAACAPAKVVTLLISDVPGDDPIDIASGAHCAGSDDLRRGACHPGALRHRPAGQCAARAHQRSGREHQARRCPARRRRPADDHHAAHGA